MKYLRTLFSMPSPAFSEGALQPGEVDHVLTAERLAFSYDRIAVLRDINLQVPRGRVTCIMGRNGVGKTTLLLNLMGTLLASAGTIRLHGVEITRWAPHLRAKAGLSLVPQGREIFPKLSVEENLLIGLQGNAHRPRSIPAEIYDTFPVLKEMRRRLGGDLSGGQQQQLAIARSLASNPSVLLLDEPTEGIQPNIIETIGGVIRKLVEERKMTIVLVEQFVSFVREFGDDVKIMERGRIVAETTASNLTEALVHHHLGVGSTQMS